MQLNTIFFIGPQGSGKGTQARMLAEKLNFFYWENGAILREVSRTDTDEGKALKALLDKGVLLKDEVIFEVLKSRLNMIPIKQGLIFDGIPRRLTQAEFIMDFLKLQGRTDFTTVYLNLPEEECIKRSLARGQKEDRSDDTLEAIKFRLQQYQTDTLPVLDFLKTHSQFLEIDGRPAIEQVTASINQALRLS